MTILQTLSGFLLLILVLVACEGDANPTEVDQQDQTSSLVAPAPVPDPAPHPEAPPMIEQVLDTMPVVTRSERPVRTPASISFEETTYTYDTIQQGEVVEYAFKFTNTGERPLSIKDVKGSCGCTIGSYPFLDIAPNEKSTIKARFDSKGKVGVQSTTITVYSNANPKGDVLSLKGFVVEPKKATEQE